MELVCSQCGHIVAVFPDNIPIMGVKQWVPVCLECMSKLKRR